MGIWQGPYKVHKMVENSKFRYVISGFYIVII
jgi:hypothetical protein